MDFRLDLPELAIIVEGLQKALNQKIYTKEEAEKIFKVWNNLASYIEQNNRLSAFNQMYSY